MIKKKIKVTSVICERVEKFNSCKFLVGMWSCAATMGDDILFPQKLNTEFPELSNSTARHKFKRTKDVCSYTNLCSLLKDILKS